MKKIILVTLILTMGLSLFAVNAEVVAVIGKAEIKTGATWQAVKQGQVLTAGTMISTGFKSQISLKIDGSLVVVQPLTRLKLEEIVQKDEAVSTNVYLDTGSIKADIKPASTKKVNFNVKTPVATASVRGTSGEITSAGKLEGSSGVWAYSNAVGESRVRAGDIVVFYSNGEILQTSDLVTMAVKDKEPLSLVETETGVESSVTEVALGKAYEGEGSVKISVSW